MIYADDSPEQGNRGGQKPGKGNFHKSQHNQDNQKHKKQPDSKNHKEDDKFGPGEPDDYNAEEFSTD